MAKFAFIESPNWFHVKSKWMIDYENSTLWEATGCSIWKSPIKNVVKGCDQKPANFCMILHENAKITGIKRKSDFTFRTEVKRDSVKC